MKKLRLGNFVLQLIKSFFERKTFNSVVEFSFFLKLPMTGRLGVAESVVDFKINMC